MILRNDLQADYPAKSARGGGSAFENSAPIVRCVARQADSCLQTSPDEAVARRTAVHPRLHSAAAAVVRRPHADVASCTARAGTDRRGVTQQPPPSRNNTLFLHAASRPPFAAYSAPKEVNAWSRWWWRSRWNAAGTPPSDIEAAATDGHL